MMMVNMVINNPQGRIVDEVDYRKDRCKDNEGDIKLEAMELVGDVKSEAMELNWRH
jgi:hypothetical protein